MNKKIYLGIILVLTLLFLMPSIPAIQQKTIEDKAYDDLVEILEDDINHVEQKQRLLSFIKSDEFLKSIESDFIQDFLQNKNLNKIYDSEKIQKLVNSETFKHLTSTDSGDTFYILGFIIGLVTWIPVLILCALITIPTILLKTIEFGLENIFPYGWPKPLVAIFLLMLGFVEAIFYWLSEIFLVAILWPLIMAYELFPFWPDPF